MTKESAPHLWIRVVLPGLGAIGPGKIELLKAIERDQSIAAAARSLGMSYRRAWMLVDETRKVLGREVVETRAGGADRGGAVLTEDARALIRAYEAIYAKANKAVQNEIEKIWPESGAHNSK